MNLTKYLIFAWRGAEQALAFPSHIGHADVFNYVCREAPGARALSAGFFHDGSEGWWHGGVSETLKLGSRLQDGELIRAMLRSRDRRDWDLRVLVWEACEAARHRGQKVEEPMKAMGM
jgi:hypothetical protein